MVNTAELPESTEDLSGLVDEIFAINSSIGWSALGREVTNLFTGRRFKGEALERLVRGHAYHQARYGILKADVAGQLRDLRDRLKRDPFAVVDRFPISPEMIEVLCALRDHFGVSQRRLIDGTGYPESHMSELLKGDLEKKETVPGALIRNVDKIWGEILAGMEDERARTVDPENMRQSVQAVQAVVLAHMSPNGPERLVISESSLVLDLVSELGRALHGEDAAQDPELFFEFLQALDDLIGDDHGLALELLDYDQGEVWTPQDAARFEKKLIPKLEAKLDSLQMQDLYGGIRRLNSSITDNQLAQEVRDSTSISKGTALVRTVNGVINWEPHRAEARKQMIVALEDVLNRLRADRFCINGAIAAWDSDLKTYVNRLKKGAGMSQTAIAQEMGIHFSFLSDLMLGHAKSIKREPYERLEALHNRTFGEVIEGGERLEALRLAIATRLEASLEGEVLFLGAKGENNVRLHIEACDPPVVTEEETSSERRRSIPWIVADHAYTYLLGIGTAHIDMNSSTIYTLANDISRCTELILPNGEQGVKCRVSIEPSESLLPLS